MVGRGESCLILEKGNVDWGEELGFREFWKYFGKKK